LSLLGSPSPGDSGAFEAGHPSAGQLEATAFGRLAERESRAIRAHAAACPICGPTLRRDETVYRRLALLRTEEPTIRVLDRVLHRLDHTVPRRRPGKVVRPALVALSVVVGAVVLASAARSRGLRARLARAW
jgi:anti-sigma factor ChrR (cupin superfamily)